MKDLLSEKRLNTPLTPELCCSNFEASLYFYTEILGFEIQYQREEEGFAMLDLQGSRIMLYLLSKKKSVVSWCTGSAFR